MIRLSSARKLIFEKMIKDLPKDSNLDDTVNSEGGDSSEEENSGSDKSTSLDENYNN